MPGALVSRNPGPRRRAEARCSRRRTTAAVPPPLPPDPPPLPPQLETLTVLEVLDDWYEPLPA